MLSEFHAKTEKWKVLKLAPVKTEPVKQNFLVAAQFSIFYLECFAFHETPILLVIKKVPVE